MKWQISENNLTALHACASDILAAVESETTEATILALSGDLGAGKTALVQALARELGVTDTVTSPTFTIMKRYQPARRYTSLIHIDAYRFETETETVPLHFKDLCMERNALICIEWPERIRTQLPPTIWQIHITIEGDETRLIELTRLAA